MHTSEICSEENIGTVIRVESNSPLYIDFIDFEKAFDSVHLPSVWRILTEYGFPETTINTLKGIYIDNQCCVKHQRQHNRSGVRQGCFMSLPLFLVTGLGNGKSQ